MLPQLSSMISESLSRESIIFVLILSTTYNSPFASILLKGILIYHSIVYYLISRDSILDFGLISNALLEQNLMNCLVCSFVANAFNCSLFDFERFYFGFWFNFKCIKEQNLMNFLVWSFVANATYWNIIWRII